jgi:DNA polymerase-1
VANEEECRYWVERYKETRHIDGLGIDSETTGLDRTRDVVVIWSISDGETRLCLDSSYLPLWKSLLEDPETDLDLTNARFDMHMFANTGVNLVKARSQRCTIVQSWLVNENNRGRHGLKECVTDHFGRRTPTFEETFGKIPPKKTNKQTGVVTVRTIGQMIRDAINDPQKFTSAVDYASLDAYNSHVLRQHFDRILEQIPTDWGDLKRYYYQVEVPYTKVLYTMERRGITVDAGYLRSLAGPMGEDMELIKRAFNQFTGRIFNPNSVNDVRKLFFETLGKEATKMTKGGTSGVKKASTDEEVLDGWAGAGDPWAEKLLKYRSIAKIKGTYVDGLQQWINPPHSYRIHTSLNQTGTVTGRLSSSDPNLQNIPRPDEDKFKIREAFIPGENRRLIVADYEQLEMRLMAHFSQDEKMIDAIKKGTDLHCFTVSEMEGISYDEVLAAKKVKKKEELTERQHELLIKRQNAKATGFGIIYGIGGPRLASGLTRSGGRLVAPDEGWRLIEQWLNVFPGVRAYMEKTKRDLQRQGYVQVITGRYRRFGDVRGMNRRDASQAERQGVNSVIQGTAAEVAKLVMIKCEGDRELYDLGVEMLLQIHDELVFECYDEDSVVDSAVSRIKTVMEHPFPQDLLVPLPVAIGTGYSWASAK